MNNAEIYIEKYIELEHTVRSVYCLKDSDSISFYLNHQEKYNKYKDKISYCQKVRNFLHHENKINNQFAIIPSDEMIQFIEDLIKEIKCESRCEDVMITDIYYRSFEDSIYETIQVMKEKDYSHVPIINHGLIVGIFNRNHIIDLFQEIQSDSTFKDIESHLAIDFTHYRMISKDLYIEDLEDIFISNYKNGNRIDLLLVTDNGMADGKLEGIVTPWIVLQE